MGKLFVLWKQVSGEESSLLILSIITAVPLLEGYLMSLIYFSSLVLDRSVGFSIPRSQS